MTTREKMMELATRVNELRASIKASRGNKRVALNDELTVLEPQLRTAQRAYIAERKAAKA